MLKYECESSGGLRLRREHPLEEIARPCHPAPAVAIVSHISPFLCSRVLSGCCLMCETGRAAREVAHAGRINPAGGVLKLALVAAPWRRRRRRSGRNGRLSRRKTSQRSWRRSCCPRRPTVKTPPTPVPCQLTVPEPPFFHAVGFTVFTGVFKPLEEVVGVMDQRVRAASDELERLVSARCARGRGTRTRTTLELELPCGHMSLSVK